MAFRTLRAQLLFQLWTFSFFKDWRTKTKNFAHFQNLLKIKFCWRQIFKILIIQKPSVRSRDIRHTVWAGSVQPFWRLLDTNRQQTPKQTSKVYIYIYKIQKFLFLRVSVYLFICMSDHEPVDQFASIFIRELGRNTGILLIRFENFKLSGVGRCSGKI